MPQPSVVVVGSLNWDVSLFVKKIPRTGEEVIVKKIQSAPGGKGGNIAVAAARILGPSQVGIVGCVGRDKVGRIQVKILKDEGVETAGVHVSERAESGQAYVTIDEQGDDTIMTHFGANALLDTELVMSSTVQTVLANSKVIVSAGSQKQAAYRVLSEGSRLRKIVVWHPGVLTRSGINEWQDAVKHVSYLILNEHESMTLTGSGSLGDSLDLLRSGSPETRVIVTLGGKGATYSYRGKTQKTREVDLEKLGRKAVNTAGCGDAFVGAFAAYKSAGFTDDESVAYANMAGALKASRQETRGSPTREELEGNYRTYYGQSTQKK